MEGEGYEEGDASAFIYKKDPRMKKKSDGDVDSRDERRGRVGGGTLQQRG